MNTEAVTRLTNFLKGLINNNVGYFSISLRVDGIGIMDIMLVKASKHRPVIALKVD